MTSTLWLEAQLWSLSVREETFWSERKAIMEKDVIVWGAGWGAPCRRKKGVILIYWSSAGMGWKHLLLASQPKTVDTSVLGHGNRTSLHKTQAEEAELPLLRGVPWGKKGGSICWWKAETNWDEERGSWDTGVRPPAGDRWVHKGEGPWWGAVRWTQGKSAWYQFSTGPPSRWFYVPTKQQHPLGERGKWGRERHFPKIGQPVFK